LPEADVRGLRPPRRRGVDRRAARCALPLSQGCERATGDQGPWRRRLRRACL